LAAEGGVAGAAAEAGETAVPPQLKSKNDADTSVATATDCAIGRSISFNMTPNAAPREITKGENSHSTTASYCWIVRHSTYLLPKAQGQLHYKSMVLFV
jgi:hypothetical protein